MKQKSGFRSGVRLGAALSQTSIHAADEVAIAAVAEEVLAMIRGTSEETLRAVLRNTLAAPRHADWFQGALEPYRDRRGHRTTMAAEWRDSLIEALNAYWRWGRGAQPFWATRNRSMTLLEGGAIPGKRRRRRARLRLVQGGVGA